MFKGHIVGNLTRDLELREVPYKGEKRLVTELPIASNRRGSEEADYVTAVVWGKDAENACKYLKKGSGVAVSGDIQIEKYETDAGKGMTVKLINCDVQYTDKKAQ